MKRLSAFEKLADWSLQNSGRRQQAANQAVSGMAPANTCKASGEASAAAGSKCWRQRNACCSSQVALPQASRSVTA